MKKKLISVLLICTMLVTSAVGAVAFAVPSAQSGNTGEKRIGRMQDLVLPTEQQYKYKDWKQTTIDFLNYVLDESNVYSEGGSTKQIARFTLGPNVDAYFKETGNQVWSIPPYIGMGSYENRLGEGITVIAAVMSGALCGMDMTAYPYKGGEVNLIKSCTEYFQAKNEKNIVLNGGAGGEGGVTFWYELLPGVLFSVLADNAPESEHAYLYDMITKSARQWRRAVVGMGGQSADFFHTSYDFNTDTPFDNGRWYEPDAAAGMAYLLYSAYSLNKNLKESGKQPIATDAEIEEFREAAIWSMNYLERIDFSPFYEVLTFLAPYLAARMNAEQGTNYNVAKMIDWTLDGSSIVRGGWGMVTENWGSHYTNGLMGSLTDGDGYAFAMNTFDAMLGFGPMLKYDTRFATDISRWVLAVSVSAQEYYPENYEVAGSMQTYEGNSVYHGKYQSGRWIQPTDPRASFIPYEGLRRYRRYVTWEKNANGQTVRSTAWDRTQTPYASGDAFTFDWGGDTDYGLYGAAHTGLFGATIFDTNVPMILRTNLNALDVFSSGSIAFNMYFNPHTEAKTVEAELSAAGNKLYNTITKSYVQTQSAGGNTVSFSLAAGQTAILAEIPVGKEVVKNGSIYTCDGEFIAQERGSVDLVLTDENNNTIAGGGNVTGTIKASLTVSVPEGASVQSITLAYGGTTLYSGVAAPSEPIVVDTTELRNGNGTMTATLLLADGVTEKATFNIRVMNIVKTPAVEYASPADMAEKWNTATAEWKTKYPNSDHNATVTVSGNGIRSTIPSTLNYGFSTSEQIYLDFSREPVLELEVTAVSHQFAIKVFVDGMTEPTGTYVLDDNSTVGKVEINLKEALLLEDRTLTWLEGAKLTSIKLAATGGTGAYVEIKDFNLYHMYTTPVLDEPSEYEWGRDYAAVWMSLWTQKEGTLTYNNEGKAVVSGGYIVSPNIKCDLGQNPVIAALPVASSGYYVGILFEGDPTIYRLGDYTGTDRRNIEVMPTLRSKYPGVDKSGEMKVQIVVGSDSSVTFGTVMTYYQLPKWGLNITTSNSSGWLDFVRQSGVSAPGVLTLDENNRAQIKNNDSVAVETGIAGMSGKYIVDFARNPVIAVTARSMSPQGQWRLTLTPFNAGKTYVLKNWSRDTSRNAFVINVADAVKGELTGEQSVYVNIEVQGGGNYIWMSGFNTYYDVIQPEWGTEYNREVGSWNRGDNPSNITINTDGQVVISESAPFSTGIIAPEMIASADYIPYLVLDVASITGDGWYVKVQHGGNVYTYGGKTGSVETGKVYINLAELCGADNGENAYTAEIGAMGEGFVLTLNNVAFVYKLRTPSAVFDADRNIVTVTLPAGATGLYYTVFDADGNKVVEQTAATQPEIGLAALSLKTGVYNMFVSATAENMLDSDSFRRAFKQGDIPSVTLAAPSGFTMSGAKVVWDDVENVTHYAYTLTDTDTGAVIASGETTNAYFDLATVGLDAFNHKIEVTAVGDDAVYLTSEKASYEFFTAVAGRFTPKAFATMSSVNNGAYGSYSESDNTAKIIVPNNANWGNISSLAFALDFDKSPVLEIKFGTENLGGYYLQIELDGKVYYLCDNTFDFSDILLDIADALATRDDGPGKITGVHNVRILFGATGDTITDSPVVHIVSARVVEMTAGKGTPYFGELATPELTVRGKTVSWNAVEHADSYSLVIKNELGALITRTLTETSFDFSILTVEEELRIEVTAMGANYYNSETAVVTFMLSNDSGEKKGCGCDSAIGASSAAAAVVVMALAVLLCKRRKTNHENI